MSKIHDLKFAAPLPQLIALGDKRTTWRLWNDKDFAIGDGINMLTSPEGRFFGRAAVLNVVERRFATLRAEDYEAHEPFESFEATLRTYSDYYSAPVVSDTPLTVIKFEVFACASVPGSEETDYIAIGNAA